MTADKHQIRFSNDPSFQRALKSLRNRCCELQLCFGNIRHITEVALMSVSAAEVGHVIKSNKFDFTAAPAKRPDLSYVEINETSTAFVKQLVGDLTAQFETKLTLRTIVQAALCAFAQYSENQVINSFNNIKSDH